METFYSLKAIAKILEIPESTARFYRDRDSEFIPFRGKGRKRKYPKEAIAVLRFICECAERNLDAIDIKEALSDEFPKDYDFGPVTQDNLVTGSQPRNLPAKVDDMFPAVQGMVSELFSKALTSTLDTIADQKRSIEALKETTNDLLAQMEVLARKPIKKRSTRAMITRDMKLMARDAQAEVAKIHANIEMVAKAVKKRA
jgi:DNA-binding transcriptional MerR regulator